MGERFDMSRPIYAQIVERLKAKILAGVYPPGGHLDSVRRMVERGDDCADVLIQLSAVISALNSTAKVILKDHMEHCILDAVEDGDHEALQRLSDAIDRFFT